MRRRGPGSLQWRLVRRLLLLHAGLLTLFVLLLFGALWGAGLLEQYEGGTLDVLSEALERRPDGTLVLRSTPALAALRASAPGLWFVVRDQHGQRLSEGLVPSEFAPTVAALEHVREARLARDPARTQGPWGTRPDALVQWRHTAAGEVQLTSGTQGHISAARLLASLSSAVLNIVVPTFLLTGLATLIATPLIVRRALGSLGEAAAQATRIDVAQRGVRLPVAGVPLEIRPLVEAVNDALGRLDEGYARHERFLADAAHELRTPIAILNTRLMSLPASHERTRLLEDAARLTVLAGQLLDLQRLAARPVPLAPVELVALARRVVLDLAPLAFAAGYALAFEPDAAELSVAGDPVALERALTNLVQNAIDHGGRRGTITVRVCSERGLEVSDEGPGIAAEQRDQVFQPFRRLDPFGHGAGLGLNLVQEIMRLHGGRVTVSDGPTGGACLRMAFPPAPQAPADTRAASA